ncbi:MAG: peptide deformylase [Planctomycetota bacterium]
MSDHFDRAPEDPSQLRLRYYPDPVLRRRAVEIDPIDDRVRQAARRMFDVMYEEQGIGLAGPQVGWLQRIFVMNLTADPEKPEAEQVLINPVLSELAGESLEEEGCLSLPEIRAKVKRPESLVVEAQDLDGHTQRFAADDLLGRCIQHENDHLDGILFITRLSLTGRMPLRKALKELERDYKDQQAR